MSVPLVFLHGWAMTGAVFEDVTARLGTGFDCHAPDLPGHGARMADEPSLDHCVEVVSALIAGLDRPVLIGWSMGAAIAWRYLARHGSRAVRGLISVDMSPRLLPDADWPYGLLGQSAEKILATSAKIEPKWRAMEHDILRNMYADDGEMGGQAEVLRDILRKQNPARLRPLWDDLVAMDERQTISGIDVPYFVFAGAKSRLYTPAVADWIAKRADDAVVYVFQKSGHSPHLEEPDAFCDAIRNFVAAEFGVRISPEKTNTT